MTRTQTFGNCKVEPDKRLARKVRQHTMRQYFQYNKMKLDAVVFNKAAKYGFLYLEEKNNWF